MAPPNVDGAAVDGIPLARGRVHSSLALVLCLVHVPLCERASSLRKRPFHRAFDTPLRPEIVCLAWLSPLVCGMWCWCTFETLRVGVRTSTAWCLPHIPLPCHLRCCTVTVLVTPVQAVFLVRGGVHCVHIFPLQTDAILGSLSVRCHSALATSLPASAGPLRVWAGHCLYARCD